MCVLCVLVCVCVECVCFVVFRVVLLLIMLMLDQTLSPQIIRFLGYTKLLPDDPNGDSLLKDATYSCD